MPGVILAESFEAGPSGTACSKTNTAFTALVEAGWTFQNTHAATGQGSLSGHVQVSGGHAIAQATFTARDAVYTTFFLWPVAAPSANVVIANCKAATAVLAELQLTTDRRLAIRNSGHTAIAQTAASFVPLGAFCRVEWMLNTATDQQRLRVYITDPYGTSSDYDSGLVTTTAVGQADTVSLGPINATTWEAFFDGYTARDDAFVSFGGGGGGGGGGGTPLLRASQTPVAVSGTGTTASIAVPTSGTGGTVAVGDTAYLIFVGSDPHNQTGPSGWASLTSQSAPGICLNVWSKTLASGDLGATLTVTSDNTSGYKRDLYVEVFSAAQVGAVTSALATTSSTGHQTPQATAVDPNALVLNLVADRASPGSQSWDLSASPNLILLGQLIGSGGGGVSSVVAYDDLVGSGPVGSNTVTGTLNTATAVMATIVVEPATATLGGTVNGGPDLAKEPWSQFTITPTASSAVDSWSWEQLSPPDVDVVTGATVDADGTIHLAAPAVFGVTRVFKLRAHASHSGTALTPDDVNVTVYPATLAVVDASGASVPARKLLVT